MKGNAMAKTFAENIVWETALPLRLLNRGKVRDIYEASPDKLLIVTTDRLSAFDVVLPDPIPAKGRVLNQISLFWFDEFKKLIGNHILESEVTRMGFDAAFVKEFGPMLQGRSVLVRCAKPLTVECVVRGYLAGSGWKEYQKTRTICGQKLPEGLTQSCALPDPIFTPTTKAMVGHDMNIDFGQVIGMLGQRTAERARELSLLIYREGARFALTKGIIIADTKFEFGVLGDELILIDEVLTPDSSRFWPKANYKVGQDQPSYDKQIVRNYLLEIGWNQTPPGPKLPDAVLQKTSRAYQEAFRKLTGKKLM
jgi:phosphoribosylaminoimidazole-succinocarboxamide synthase